jgi:voltage-gated potassium channel
MFREFIAAHLGLLYELSGVLLLLIAVVAVAGALIARFDRIPLEDALYFACITAFTVGFGDVVPRSRGARVVTVLLALLGLMLVGVAVAVAVHALDSVLAARGVEQPLPSP